MNYWIDPMCIHVSDANQLKILQFVQYPNNIVW